MTGRPIVIELKEAPFTIYICRQCGTAHTDRIRDERSSEYLRRLVTDCRHGATITPIPPNLENSKTRAEVVTDLEECFGDQSGEFYPSLEDAAEAGETGVFAAGFESFELKMDNLIEAMLEGHHDDAGPSDLSGLDDLEQAVTEFNKQQRGGSFFLDTSRWQEIPHMKTFAMIKPCAFARGDAEKIKSDIIEAGFSIERSAVLTLSKSQAEWLYREHSKKSHFADLVDFTISGPVEILMVSGKDSNVPMKFRELMGPTKLDEAAPGTLRAKYAEDFRRNAIHGSDGPMSAIDELQYFYHCLPAN